MMQLRTQPSLNRDFALIALFIVFVLVLISGWVTVETIRDFRATVGKQMESEARLLDRAVAVEIENASYILESVGRQIQANGTENETAISQLFFSFNKSEGPRRGIFSWVTKDQQLTVASNLGLLKEPIDVADRDYMKKSIAEPWKVHIGRPIDGRLSQKWIRPLSLGLTDASGTYAGSVIVALDTEKLAMDVGRTLKGSGTRFAITNHSLTLLTQSDDAQRFFETFKPKSLANVDFDEHPSGTFRSGSLLEGTQSYRYYVKSETYPYIIFLGLDPATTSAALRKQLMPRLFQLIVNAVFLLFILYTARRRIIQPVIALTVQAATIVRGEKFTEAPPGPPEIENLGYEIRRLYEYIEERRRVEAELRLKNAELNRIKEAAQLTNQVKAEFFAYIGEQLTEPTEMILEQIETIKDQHFGPLGSPLYAQHAYEVHEHARQLLAMLSDIKSISEAETGLLALNETDVDLPFVLQKTVRIFRDKNPGNVDVQFDIATHLPRLRADELRIKQLVLNILQSTARHLGPGDVIRITSSLKAQELALIFSYVTNTGSDSRLKSLGTVLATPSRTKHGLELALARLLVAMHQGTLEMKTAQDRTTTVTVRFPAVRVV